MRAVLRLGLGLFAAGLALAPMPALGQDSAAPTTNTPATDAVGPRELQNFSINGTVTRPADEQPVTRSPVTARRPAQRPTTTPAQQADVTTPKTPRPATKATEQAAASPQPQRREVAEVKPEPRRQTAPSSSVTVALPKLQDDLPRGGNAAAVPASAPGFAEPESPAATLAPERRVPLLPWLLAAMVLAAGGLFLFWRNRSRLAYAGAPQVDAFSAPEPVAPTPAPRPAPIPAGRPPSSIPGLVSTRLRPWIDFNFQPSRCIVDDNLVTVEFELELFNSGSAPARAVLVEATLFNAGPNQDSDIGSFFANPVGEGDRIAAIAPLKRIVLRPKVIMAREHVQLFEVGGREVFVPLIAFNALYSWSGGEGQSSISYLLGRDTQGEKLAPFRLDRGARVFRGLGSRPLPAGVRN